ncbi:MAG: tetratricopeptide repeat protein [Candidatus Acidiferrales bacterium]
MPRAKAAARKALEIDGTLPEAHTSLAFVKWQYDWDWVGAEKDFQRALEVNPGYATAHHWYAYQLITQGRKEHALREIRLAQELDPLSLIINTDLGEILCYAGRYDEAIQQSKQTLEMDPSFTLARRVLGWTYARKGMHAESIAELQKAMAISGSRADLLMSLAYSYAMAGKRVEARAVLAQMKTLYGPSPDIAFGLAVAYAAAGEKDRAFASLDKAYRERSASMVLVGVTPVLDPLRTDPRFAALLRRVGLPP